MINWEKKHAEAAKEEGYCDLLNHYMNQANTLLDIWGIEFNDDSIVVSLKLPSGNRPWNILSVWPSKSSKDLGLWIGYSDQNYNKIFTHSFPQGVLPPNFDNTSIVQHDNHWLFGWVATKDALDKIISACDRD